jgi:hypothetical protein
MEKNEILVGESTDIEVPPTSIKIWFNKSKEAKEVFSFDDESNERVLNVLTTPTVHEFKDGDKVYIVQNFMNPKIKLKEYFRTRGIKIVTDVEKANLLYIHDNMISSTAADYLKMRSLIYDLRRQRYDYGLLKTVPFDGYLPGKVEGDIVEEPILVNKQEGLDRRMQHLLRVDNERPGTCNVFYSEEAILLYSMIEAGKLEVIHEKDVLQHTNNQLVIDNEETYELILTSLQSKDESEKLLGYELLGSCDVEKSIEYLWRICKESYYYLSMGEQYKSIRMLMHTIGAEELRYMDHVEFLYFLKQKNWCTQEKFDRLEPLIRKSFIELVEPFRDIYKIKVEIKQLVDAG